MFYVFTLIVDKNFFNTLAALELSALALGTLAAALLARFALARYAALHARFTAFVVAGLTHQARVLLLLLSIGTLHEQCDKQQQSENLLLDASSENLNDALFIAKKMRYAQRCKRTT